ncbi:MAG: GAF domain-containing protein [Oscillatoriales cyanobacterium RM2_1_1]|nr:GAF domain-containing protein [Oscillatoriales cyanobacterium SM2_3_0]NJO47153.1 GAF domain-containing protein [Oscillatoriales cyanobacterium RM2_1_1]
MSISTSVVADLADVLPQLRPQVYFKSSLTALSHAMEDQVLANDDQPLVIATFQQERFYRQEAHRYRRIAALSSQVYVMAAPETEFQNASGIYEMIAFGNQDQLCWEWNLVVLGQRYSTCLACVELKNSTQLSMVEQLDMDQARPFEGIWTSDRQVSCKVAELLLQRIIHYRPELAAKVEQACQLYKLSNLSKVSQSNKGRKSTARKSKAKVNSLSKDCSQADPFAQRLVTYLQAGQHKLLRVYRSLAAQERKERLINSITMAIRQSLNTQEILKVAAQELGEAMAACRCLIYRCKSTDATVVLHHEFLRVHPSETFVQNCSTLVGQIWPLQKNPLFQTVSRHQVPVYSQPGSEFEELQLQQLAQQWQIWGWLMVPIAYQGQLLGIVELHQSAANAMAWQDDELALVDAIATQLAAALIQAETYANLEDLNQQLEALERTRSNLIAITGHELRTPLSTIQVCLESLNQEPDMMPEMRQIMLETALADAERLRKVIQDFLTLSNLESGRVDWSLETLPLQECIDLAISGIRSRHSQSEIPEIDFQLPADLPLVQVDGEWLVELLSKLLDNACKFTGAEGKVTIRARQNGGQMLEVTIADTGRGIEPSRLEAIFDRFYQEEGSLQRTVGGTGLGLAIGKQIVSGWGGRIWANSAGKNQGSEFHFTIPLIEHHPE